jgi:exopolyphosphatase/guanosine-5'-triphosphate,3'-diphosphate pyrophosphatase
MNIAVIDIGTNTVLLLVAGFTADGRIIPLVYEQRVPRLGKGVDESKNLPRDAMERTIAVIEEYQQRMAGFDLTSVVVCGTSAIRDAQNKNLFAELVYQRTGLSLEVLTGKDEALWSYRGAISGLPNFDRATVVDIGGGSTEIVVGTTRGILSKASLDIGSVRLTERFFRHDPPTHPELESATTFVEDELARPKGFAFDNSVLVGVAGTATSLAILDQGLHNFSIDAVTDYRLRLDNVYALFRTLRELPSVKIGELSTALQGRNDIITAGALILREIMAHYKFSEMIVSERGLRYGIAIREWEKQRSTSGNRE